MADHSQRVSAATIKVYLSAIRLYHLENNQPDPPLDDPLLHYLCSAIRREHPAEAPKRLPILPHHLCAIKTQLSDSSLLSHDKLMYWAAFTFAFFGFCRVSEYTSPSPTHSHPKGTLSLEDITLTDDALSVNLQHSKTNQFGRTETISMGATRCSLCPVRAMSKYVRIRHKSPSGPLFVLFNGHYLTRKDVSKTTKRMLLKAGFDPLRFTSHSYRIGAATSAASAGLPDHLIKHLGRWSSNAYQRYIHPASNSVLSISQQLSSVPR